jgi:hypothetical protein
MKPETYNALGQITDDEWRRIILELGRYALSVSRRLRWRTENPSELPNGETIDSIVSLAIEKVISGERSWDPAVRPDLRKYLMDVIDSLLSHLAESKDNTMLARLPAEGAEQTPSLGRGFDQVEPGSAWLPQPGQSPEAELLAKEQAQLEDRAFEVLIEECDGDPVLKRMVEAIFDGRDKPSEIAEATGIPTREIYNAARRLDRKCEIVRRRLQAERPRRDGS